MPRTRRSDRSQWRAALFTLASVAAACRAPETPEAPERRDAAGAAHWMVGDWHGTRTSEGESAPITVHVELLPDGTTQLERLEVSRAGGAYVGFSVRSFVWRSVSPGRTRESMLVSRRVARLVAHALRR